jgi:hypothetical protein
MSYMKTKYKALYKQPRNLYTPPLLTCSAPLSSRLSCARSLGTSASSGKSGLSSASSSPPCIPGRLIATTSAFLSCHSFLLVDVLMLGCPTSNIRKGIMFFLNIVSSMPVFFHLVYLRTVIVEEQMGILHVPHSRRFSQ